MLDRTRRPARYGLAGLFAGLLAGTAAVGGACSTVETAPVNATETDSGAPGDAFGDTFEDTGGAADAPVLTAFPATVTTLTADDERMLGKGHADPNLIDAWGLAFSPSGVAWISASGSDEALLYDTLGAPKPLVVSVPPSAAGGRAAPTGQIYNGVLTDFFGDKFILAGLDGAIAGWSTGTAATLRVDGSASGARYTGLALVVPITTGSSLLSTTSDDTLVATDFHGARVDVFDAAYQPVGSVGAFLDPALPAGFAPFNAAQIGGEVYVAYAQQDQKAAHDRAAPGDGLVSVFDTTGQFLRRFASGPPLDAPWGLAQVPNGLGALSGTILVGNFGDGSVLVYDADGTPRGVLSNAAGQRIFIDGLWSLTFFAPAGGAPALYYTAGPRAEAHGVFGRIDLSP